MKVYQVYIEIAEQQVLAGYLHCYDDGRVRFAYDDEYICSDEAAAVSLSLPLRPGEFPETVTAAYFEGLLPEGFTRRYTEKWLHVEDRNYTELLFLLGRECLGAIRISDGEDDLTQGYEPIDRDRIRALASEGTVSSAGMITDAHLSLTGASGKVGLYYNTTDGGWFLPRGSAPSTHIVKQSHIRLGGIVVNEQLCMMTARRCGIDVPESFVINTGNGEDESVLFATARYDRTFSGHSTKIDGLTRPARRHQEDFAQAMGIASAHKYETPGGGYLPRMFEILRENCDNPIEDRIRLWKRICFNILIGNTDAHLKNFSLLYDENLRGLRLAPAYDIICTTIYEGSSRRMGFACGEAERIDDVTGDSLRAAASSCGMGVKPAIHAYEQIAGEFESALKESGRELADGGIPGADKMAERILAERSRGKLLR